MTYDTTAGNTSACLLLQSTITTIAALKHAQQKDKLHTYLGGCRKSCPGLADRLPRGSWRRFTCNFQSPAVRVSGASKLQGVRFQQRPAVRARGASMPACSVCLQVLEVPPQTPANVRVPADLRATGWFVRKHSYRKKNVMGIQWGTIRQACCVNITHLTR